jgi:predicted  nucleic acid-binding Zn-ribbon protein
VLCSHVLCFPQLESQVQSLQQRLEAADASVVNVAKLQSELDQAKESVKLLKFELQQAKGDKTAAVKELADLKAAVQFSVS